MHALKKKLFINCILWLIHLHIKVRNKDAFGARG